MIARLIIAALALLCSDAAGADPVIRGVFVGVDRYLYSRPTVSFAEFGDLRGAAADAAAIKNALRIAYHLDLDTPGTDCRSSNAVSITLINTCATRDAILAALSSTIAASAPNDTVIFYFAGHGSTKSDDVVQDQASGFNDTILPTDARQPDGPRANDILDREIRGIIDVANARGVNVVTIFDSCNSGTGARGEFGEGESRGVAGITGHGEADYKIALAPVGPGGGYRVHFGAARDDEEAREVRSGDTTNGVFTTALAQAILAHGDATFGDLAADVRRRVEQAGMHSQHPQAEGALQARFGGAANRTPLFAAEVTSDGVTLGAGRLLGMTRGSTFALFETEAAALDPAQAPLASATIDALQDGTASLRLSGRAAIAPGTQLIAREISHAPGDTRLRVAVSEGVAPARSRLIAALRRLGFVEIVAASAGAQVRLVRRSGTEDGPVLAFSRDGTGLSALGEVTDGAFADRLRAVLLPVYNAQRLLALASTSSAKAGVGFCLSPRLDHPVQECPEPADRDRKVPVDTPLVMTITNTGEAARYIHVLVIDDRFGITQLIPASHGNDPPIVANGLQRPPPFKLDTRGLYHFVTITSDVEINAATLEQPPVPRGRDGGDCEGQAGCTDGQGARGGIIPVLAAWTVTVDDAQVR